MALSCCGSLLSYCNVAAALRMRQRLRPVEHADDGFDDASMMFHPGDCTGADANRRAPLGAS